jgi:hypothetical protein
MSAPDAMDMAETAALVGYTWDRFRKVWRKLCREVAFPAPFICAPVGRPRWSRAAVEAWKAGRDRALTPTERLPSHQGPAVGDAGERAARQARAELRKLMAA